MELQPVIQNKLLNKIDDERPPRTLREAYKQALDIEKKNQITKQYKVPAQIIECTMDEECEDIEAMEFRLRENGNHSFSRGNRGQQTNFRGQRIDNFGCGSRTEYTTQRQNFTNNNSCGIGRGQQGLNQNF